MVLVEPKEDVKYYVDGYLLPVLEGFRKVVKNRNTSVVIVIDGRSGMGKTTLANQVCKFLDPNYNLDRIYYEPENFLNGLANSHKEQAHMFDEAMLISNRSALSQINRMTIQAMSMIRSKQIFVVFCVNSIFDLDKNLVLSRADLLLHVYGDNLVDRGNFAAFFKPRGGQDKIKQLYLSGKRFYSYSKPPANFYGRFYSKFIVNEKEYERRKQIGVNNFLRSSSPITKHKVMVTKGVKWMRENTKLTIPEIAQILGVSARTIDTYISRGRKLPI